MAGNPLVFVIVPCLVVVCNGFGKYPFVWPFFGVIFWGFLCPRKEFGGI